MPDTPVPCDRQLPYLESVILETLRLRPPAYIVGRCASQADNLAGFQVEPGERPPPTTLTPPLPTPDPKDFSMMCAGGNMMCGGCKRPSLLSLAPQAFELSQLKQRCVQYCRL